MDKIQEELLKEVYDDKNRSQKSSHWQRHTNRFEFADGKVKGIDGFSGRSRKYIGSNFIHKMLQKRNFWDLDIPVDSKYYKNAMTIASKQKRCIDLDLLRHVFTLCFLEENICMKDIENICIIGDGQANLTSLVVESGHFNKVLNINLAEVLLSDWELIKQLDNSTQTKVICNNEELDNFFKSDNIVGLIPSSRANIIRDSHIDLFVNIASFQEMEARIIEDYFEIMKSSSAGATLYCCNRKEKRLYGGEIIRFQDYPWDKCTYLSKIDKCPWHQRFYKLRRARFVPIPKTGINYEGIHLHRLARFDKPIDK